MHIKRNGIVMRIAYLGSIIPEEGQVNICPLFWRFIIKSILIIPGFALGTICFGARINIFPDQKDNKWPDGQSMLFVPYEHWPIRFGGVNIGLGVVILLAIFLVLSVSILRILFTLGVKIHQSLSVFGVYFVSGAIIFLLLTLLYKYRNSEVVLIVREFLSAKMKKMCFLVEITE